MTAAERDCRAAHQRAVKYADMARIDPWFRGLAAMDYQCAAHHADRIVAESADPVQVKRYTRNAIFWREQAAALGG